MRVNHTSTYYVLLLILFTPLYDLYSIALFVSSLSLSVPAPPALPLAFGIFPQLWFNTAVWSWCIYRHSLRLRCECSVCANSQLISTVNCCLDRFECEASCFIYYYTDCMLLICHFKAWNVCSYREAHVFGDIFFVQQFYNSNFLFTVFCWHDGSFELNSFFFFILNFEAISVCLWGCRFHR